MIYLHLGAHKTATTYLQSVLELNQGRIAAGGRAYWRLDQIRPLIGSGTKQYFPPKGLSGALFRGLSIKTSAYRALMRLLSVDRPIILSEENILGHPYETLGGRFYVSARRRLSYIRYVIGQQPTEIWLCVRAYPDFLSSMYAEALRHGYAVSIADFVARNSSPAGQWPALVELVHSIFPEARLVMWDYETFRALEPVILERLSGAASGTLRPLVQPDVRTSASKRAVELQAASAAAQSGAERELSMAALEDQYPPDRFPGRFSPWDPAATARMTKAYEADLAVLRALPYVEFLKP